LVSSLARRLKNRTLRGPGGIRLGDEEDGEGLDGDEDLSEEEEEEEEEVRSPGGGGARSVVVSSSFVSLPLLPLSLPLPLTPTHLLPLPLHLRSPPLFNPPLNPSSLR